MASLIEFFEGIGRDWRGWEGARTWSAMEGEFSLSCTSDRLGHVFLAIQLRGQYDSWDIAFQIQTEASQIEALARAMRKEMSP